MGSKPWALVAAPGVRSSGPGRRLGAGLECRVSLERHLEHRAPGPGAPGSGGGSRRIIIPWVDVGRFQGPGAQDGGPKL